jgi:hypothetical protein
LWACVALFAARVVGQIESSLLAPAWLPDMDAWYSGLLPYPVLLPVQIAILMLMAVLASNPRITSGSFARAHPLAAQAMRLFAGVYFAVMAVRLAVNVDAHGMDFWREGAIPVAFHWVLALFVMVSGRASADVGRVRVPAEQQNQNEEPDDVAYGDIPAVPKPLHDGPAFREEVRYRDAG